MGYELRPRIKTVGTLHLGAFSWSWMLDNGLGLPLCVRKGISPGSFVYKTRPDGLCVYYNDAAKVSAKEAMEMSKIATWVADYEDALFEIYQKSTEEEKKFFEASPKNYKMSVRRDFVDKLREFSVWAKRSGGFRVY